MREAAYVSTKYFQLKIEHTVTGTYLHCIRKEDTDQCCKCTLRAQMDTHHTMFDSRKWSEEKRKIQERCEKDDRGQPRNVRQLMGSRRMTPTVLGFIAATRAGQRAQK